MTANDTVSSSIDKKEHNCTRIDDHRFFILVAQPVDKCLSFRMA